MTDSSPLSGHHSTAYITKFNPDDYLKTMYTQLSPIYIYYIRGLLHSLHENASHIPKDGKALDFGGGASLWPSFTLSHYIDTIQFCDYTPANLQAIQAWLDHSDKAHDWTTFFRFILHENHNISESELSTYEDQLRKALSHYPLSTCDVHNPNCPILSGPANQYDVIVSCECLEGACRTYDAYKQAIQRLVRILKPNGLLIIFGVINCSYYMVGNERFESLSVNEKLVYEAMEEAGIKQLKIQSEKIGDENDPLADYYGAMVITAIKPNS